MNFIELIQRQAEQVFGNKTKAEAWLNQPKSEFSGSTPMQHAQNGEGYQ